MDGKGKQHQAGTIKKPKKKNRVSEIRKKRMMSKAELARAAGISPLTIDRVERGFSCRMDTKRKILRALNLDLSHGFEVFPEDDEGASTEDLPPSLQKELTPQLTFPIVSEEEEQTVPSSFTPNQNNTIPLPEKSFSPVDSNHLQTDHTLERKEPQSLSTKDNKKQNNSQENENHTPLSKNHAANKHVSTKAENFLATSANQSDRKEDASGEGDVSGAS